MSELKPCPFCGGEAHTYRNSLWHVGCEKAFHGCVTMSAFVTEAEAIAAWNNRAPMSYEDLKILLDELGVSERVCDITELFDSSGDVVATYCGCGCLLDREDNYCPNCGAKVVSE